MQPAPVHFEHVEELRQIAYMVIGWLVCGGVAIAASNVVVYIFKDSLKERWEGFVWRRGTEYRSMDQVWFYQFKQAGVIEYMAKYETVFTMYDVNLETGEVTGGKRLKLRNSDLRNMHIARLKPQIGDPRVMPKFMVDQIRQLIEEKEQ